MTTGAPHTRYYLGFNLIPGIGPTRLARLLDRCGSVAAAWEASSGDMLAAGLEPKIIASFSDLRRTIDLDAQLERVQQAHIQIVTLEDDSYPRLLRQVPAAPPMLYVRGTLLDSDEWAIAVVGTRSPTSYGKEATRKLVGDLARNGITIVSGLAGGIDSTAHTAALDGGARTLAVLGHGLDTIYPDRNRKLAQQIVQQGALISDYPLGTRPVAANFPPRNRIISGLSLGTLVVEAPERSGALITADFAVEQGREVFALPGSIFNRTSQGTHDLIRKGAALVRSGADMLDELHLSTAPIQQEMSAALPADPTEAALLEHITAEPQHVDVLARNSSMSVSVVAATLALLELKGHVRQVGYMEYVRAR